MLPNFWIVRPASQNYIDTYPIDIFLECLPTVVITDKPWNMKYALTIVDRCTCILSDMHRHSFWHVCWHCIWHRVWHECISFWRMCQHVCDNIACHGFFTLIPTSSKSGLLPPIAWFESWHVCTHACSKNVCLAFPQRFWHQYWPITWRYILTRAQPVLENHPNSSGGSPPPAQAFKRSELREPSKSPFFSKNTEITWRDLSSIWEIETTPTRVGDHYTRWWSCGDSMGLVEIP